MLEKDPDARPSAAELADQLDGVDMRIFRDDSWLNARREAQADSDKAELATPTPEVATGDTRVIGYQSSAEDDEKTETITSGRPTRRMEHKSGPSTTGRPEPRVERGIQKPETVSRRLSVGAFRGVLGLAAVLTLAVPSLGAWAWMSGSLPEPAALPGIEMDWVDGDLYPAGNSTVQGITSPERLLEDFYVVSDESIARSACVSDAESDDYLFGQDLPVFEVLAPGGEWQQVAEGELLGPSNCPDGHQLIELVVSADTLSQWDLVEECTMYRYRESATVNFAGRFEQWCVTFQ